MLGVSIGPVLGTQRAEATEAKRMVVFRFRPFLLCEKRDSEGEAPVYYPQRAGCSGANLPTSNLLLKKS